MKQKPDKHSEEAAKAGKSGKKPSADAKGKTGLRKQKDIEAAFGGKMDIGDVKVHADDDKGPGAIGARAFAMGEKIAFSKESPAGKLPAHEAAHVVQQRAGVAPAVRAQSASLTDDAPGKSDPDAKSGAGKKEIDLPFKNELEAALGSDLSSLKPFVSSEALKMVESDAFSVGDTLVFSESTSIHVAAEEAIHAIQQGGDRGEPSKSPVFLKHPDASEGKTPDDKPKSAADIAKGKPKIEADSKSKLEVPLDSDTLGALGDRMYEKLEREVKSERDVTGSD